MHGFIPVSQSVRVTSALEDKMYTSSKLHSMAYSEMVNLMIRQKSDKILTFKFTFDKIVRGGTLIIFPPLQICILLRLKSIQSLMGYIILQMRRKILQLNHFIQPNKNTIAYTCSYFKDTICSAQYNSTCVLIFY